jgi:hypothetical protein
MPNEPFGLVGARVEDATTAAIVPGSIIVQCYECRRDMWLAPSSQKVIMSAKRIICTRCLLFEVRVKPDAARTFARLPGSIAEQDEYDRKRGAS